MLQLAQVSTASESNPCARQPQDKVRENGTGKNEGERDREERDRRYEKPDVSLLVLCLLYVRCHSNCLCRVNAEPSMLPASWRSPQEQDFRKRSVSSVAALNYPAARGRMNTNTVS